MPHHPQRGHHQPSRRWFTASRALFMVSALLVVASAVIMWRFWNPAYFAIMKQPFHWGRPATPPAADDLQLPGFATSQSIAKSQLAPGDTQTIAISATAKRDTSSQVDAWIMSPKHKQVWRSPNNTITRFPAGQTVFKTYTYTVPTTVPKGQYLVSLILDSPDGHTNYAVQENFAEFTVQ